MKQRWWYLWRRVDSVIHWKIGTKTYGNDITLKLVLQPSPPSLVICLYKASYLFATKWTVVRTNFIPMLETKSIVSTSEVWDIYFSPQMNKTSEYRKSQIIWLWRSASLERFHDKIYSFSNIHFKCLSNHFSQLFIIVT